MDNSPILPLRLTQKKGMTETISQLARRHMTDPSHTTTDEELLHAKVELTGSDYAETEQFPTTSNTHVLNPFPTGEHVYKEGKTRSAINFSR